MRRRCMPRPLPPDNKHDQATDPVHSPVGHYGTRRVTSAERNGKSTCHCSSPASSHHSAYSLIPICRFTVRSMATMDASRAAVISEASGRSPRSSDDERSGTVTRWRLLAASTLMLFIELALIRWLGAEVLHLSYFSNFVLLGSFLGVGLGFLRAAGPTHSDRPLPLYSPVVLLGLVGFVSAYPVTVDRSGAELIFFTSLGTNGPPIWLTLPAMFLAVAAVLA